ncbi:MAG: hypothetical protein F4164_15545 [Gemmatimonadales bacterium]|nr:hypothetical protein [Gemmatimonadales bacterium]MYK03189.1 hypothetical protein [Candidatus Palauibacter ramosifaciens]
MSRARGVIGSRSRPARVEAAAANRPRPPSGTRWPGTVSRTIALGLAGALGSAGCGGPDADDGRVYFSESTSHVYEIGPSDTHLDQLDERVSFGSIIDVVAVPGGYFVADGLDPRIVLLDEGLNPVRTMGREGEGPGEYRLPWHLSRADDRVLVHDSGNGRVTYLTLEGDFVASRRFPGLASGIAGHPELGLLVAGDAFPDHYLTRVSEQAHTAFGPIPAEWIVDPEDSDDSADKVQLPEDRVAVTPDGLVHVLDGDRLALVSYRPDGELVGIVFLPKEMQAREVKQNEEMIEALGGRDRVLSSPVVMSLTPLDDGRLLAGTTSAVTADGLVTRGRVLDLERLEAIPLVFGADVDRPWARAVRVDIDRLDRAVLNPMWTASLEAAPVRLVDRDR